MSINDLLKILVTVTLLLLVLANRKHEKHSDRDISDEERME